MSGTKEPTRVPMDQRQFIDRIVKILAKCESTKWYGDLTITLKAGEVQLIRMNQIIKPDELG